MKKRAAMGGVQTFSFLDAMICTLGALLVLLHAFARHGQTESLRKAKAKAAQQSAEDPKVALELLQWRVEELNTARAKTEVQLADERLRLAHVEDHHRRLQAKLDQLKAAAAELQHLARSGKNDRLRDLAALEALRVRLTEARDAVKRARRESKRAANYSVVPYEGPNATHRRPIYIECRADAMILQPEGVEITPDDFAGFLGPGNPLASSLRGACEYYAQRAPPDKTDSEPYPLLLVRPEGVATYYAALGALESWGAQFGYELIDSDWELKFAEPDERLAHLLRRIVADSRQRMRELMLATAELRSHRPRTTLRASSGGGFVAESGTHPGAFGRSRLAQGRAWDSLDSDWLRGSSRSGSDNRGAAIGAPATVTRDGLAGEDGQASLGGLHDNAGNVESSQSDARSPAGHFQTDRPDGDHPIGQYGDAGVPMADRQNPTSPNGSTANASARPSTGPNRSASAATAGDPDSQMAAAGDGQSGAPGSDDPSPTGGDSANVAGGRLATTPRTTGGAATGGSASSSRDPASAATHESIGKHKHTSSIAESRGSGWGLPEGSADLTGVTRPILVECHPDRLVIVPERRGQQPRVTQLNVDARESIDEFVASVWQHMKSWGIAGRGLYWKPTLVLAVHPDAADRYAEIKMLLSDSGLDVRARRSTASQPSTTPPRPLR